MPSLLSKLSEDIESLAALAASCAEPCIDVRHDRGEGILPRCLFLEPGPPPPGATEAEELAGGTIVIGLNPGRMEETERRKINGLLNAIGKDRDRFSTDDWRSFVRSYYHWLKATLAVSEPYYTLVRALLRSSGRLGPILWTEILKCETRRRKPVAEGSKRKDNPDPFNAEGTVGRCTAKFLRKELELTPKEWPVLAVGKPALDWCMENATGRIVVGVPHASRRAFEFISLFPPTQVDAKKLEWVHGKRHWPIDQ